MTGIQYTKKAREPRQTAAKTRQAVRDVRKPIEQHAELDRRGAVARKERARLDAAIAQ